MTRNTTAALSAQHIVELYRAIHRREPEPGLVEQCLSKKVDLYTLLCGALESEEFRTRMRRQLRVKSQPRFPTAALAAEFERNSGMWYNTPQQLRVTNTPIDRVLLVGHCFVDHWPAAIRRLGFDVHIDFQLLRLSPPIPPYPLDRYSFQIANIPLRGLLTDVDYFSWIRNGFDNPAEAQRVFDSAMRTLDLFVTNATALRSDFPVFVHNFQRFQHSVNGRLLRSYDLNDNLYFIEELNKQLAARLAGLSNVHLFDVDNILGVLGRRSVQDDVCFGSNHGGVINDAFFEEDSRRMIRPIEPSRYFETNVDDFVGTLWLEAEAMYRTLRQVDSVKMICVDLDDTLWRGVLSEEDDFDARIASGGWPLGVAEALLVLRRRGILLAIVSKNTEGRIREIFPKVFGERLTLEDFAISKINWRPKVENIAAAMAEANLLPRSVVFLDDNPVERAAVKSAFPDIRTIEASHYYWKRILLWSPETQVGAITAESARRTEMVRSQVERESLRESMTRESFLADLRVRARLFTIKSGSKPFARALELLNKTNQFNTTGKRWTRPELESAVREQLVLGCEVSDRFTDYGLVLVAVIRGSRIEQIVMSCRVISLDVELAALSQISNDLLERYGGATAGLIETDANLLSRDLYQRAGWQLVDGLWRTEIEHAPPPHVALTREGASLFDRILGRD
jgi:FkbH-like protein